MLVFMMFDVLVISPYSVQDWSRHRKECIPAMSASTGYNVNMIATPPPAEPQYITVSAILFAPEEGQLLISTVSLLLHADSYPPDRTTKNYLR